jgi:hypothetical protein
MTSSTRLNRPERSASNDITWLNRKTGEMTARTLIVGWLCATVGFLVGEYGMGIVLNAVYRSSGIDGVLTWGWLPWIVAPVLAGIGGGFAYRPRENTHWWHWLIVAAPIPVGAYIITRAYFAAHGQATPGLLMDTLIQLAIACTLTLGIGLVRTRLSGRTGGLGVRGAASDDVPREAWQ